jgi:hypothetical protein
MPAVVDAKILPVAAGLLEGLDFGPASGFPGPEKLFDFRKGISHVSPFEAQSYPFLMYFLSRIAGRNRLAFPSRKAEQEMPLKTLLTAGNQG